MGPMRRIVTIKRSGVDGPHFPLSLSTCLFGRGIECDIRIQLPVVSKQHCKIEINEQEAILHNFSSTNPTQVNGSVIDEPVQLKHGDVITIIDRSFRYENESLQKRSKSTEFPRKIHGQEPARRVSRSSFSSNPDGKAPDSKAYSKITEGKVSGSPQVHINTVKEDSTADDSEDSVAQETSDVHSSEHAGRNGRNAAHCISGDFREISRVKLMSHCGELKSPSTTQCLDDSQKNESPFRKLYQSMKKELDVKSQKENLPQYHRKSGLQTDYTTEKENADGLQQETQLLFSRKSRPKSGGSSHAMAEPASPERELAQAKGKGRDVESVQTPSKAVGASSPLYEPAQMKTPEQYPQQQNSPEKHKNKHLYPIGRRESANLRKNEAFEAGDKTLTPRKLSARNRTPAKAEDAADSAAKPGNLSSKTRGSIPTDVEVPPRETEIQNDPFLTLWLTEVERKIQKDSLHKPEKVGATTGQMCPELPGLSAVDISNCGDSLNKSEGIPLKRRRVSFGGHLRPELFDENLPPNTPLKRGETPTKRKSLVVHTPPVLKKIIKEQPQPSAEQQSTSEIHLEVTAQSLVTGPPAPSPRKTPVANDRRSCQAAPASSSKSQTEVSKRGGRKSGNLPSKRASLRRSQHGILQMICSKRRSGASEANLIVAKSWADVVKLGAKQTQTKVVKHGPQRSVIKRQRRPATPKKPAGNVHSQFSTGHANSPCTIIIGKAYTEKVHLPAQPCRMFNDFISNQKRDFKEDLSGIAEMFKTPVKEQPQLTSTCHIAISNSENLLGKKVQVTNSGEEPLLPTSESLDVFISGGNAFFSARKAAKELSDRCSVSPALTRPSIRENGNTAETPRNTYKMTSVEMKTSDTETEPSKTVPSANKLRRSTELRNVQKLPEESKSEETNTGVAAHIIGRCQKTTPLQRKRGGEMKEIERPFETYKENIELKENVEKMEAVKRSRRTWGQKGERVSDLTDLKSLPDTERTKDLAHGQELLQTRDHAKAPESEKGKITKMPCKSLQPEPIDTPTRMKQWPKTSLGKVGVKEEPLVAGKLTRTPGETTHTHTEPAGDGRSIRTFKESPRQILNPVAYVTGMKRWPRTSKEEAQSLEDLAGFKELFQTPGHTEESMTDDKTTNIPSKSPPPESVDTPTSTKQRPKRSLRKADIEEELLALRKLTPSAGKAMHTPKPAAGNEKDIKALMRTPVQKLDLIGNLPGSKRQQQTPKEKAQALEDLAGFKELFQTPGHTEESVAAGKSTKIRCKSLQPDPVDTPTSTKQRLKRSLRKADIEEEFLALRKLTPSAGKAMHTPKPAVGEEKDINTFVGTPVQKLDLPDNLIGSKRRPQTPKEKAQALEDLAGFKELFKTPGHPEESMTYEKPARIACKSSQPDPDKTPASSKRWLRTSLGKVGEKEELLAVGKLTQMPVGTTHTHTEPTGDGKSIRAVKESPKQILDPAASLTGSKRQPKNSKEKAEVPEDLVGFKELFQTPGHTKESMTNEITTKILYSSSPPDPVDIPTSSKPQPKRSLRKADAEEFLAFRKLTPSAGKATHTPKPAGSEEKDINALMRTPVQKLDLPGNLPGSRRRPQTPKEKAQALEDLTGFKELFQTPCTDNPTTDKKTTKIPCKSPQPNPVDTPTSTKQRSKRSLRKTDIEEEFSALGKLTPLAGKVMHTPKPAVGEDKDSTFVGTPVQKPAVPGNLPRSKRRPQTPKERAQAHALEELAGFRELFQTPDHTEESTATDKITKVSCKSPQPDPVKTPTSSKRRLKTSLGKASVKEEVLAVVKLTQTSGETMHTHRGPARNGKSIRVFKESAKQMLDSADYVTGMKRWPRTPKEEAQSLEDLAGFKELFQTPGHTEESKTDDKTTNIPCKSPPESVDTPTSTRRQPKTPLGKRNVVEELSALKRLTQTPGGTTHTDKAPGGEDTGIKVFKETAKQKLDPAASVTGSKKQPRTPKRKAQSLEDLTGLKELFQTPVVTDKPRTNEKTTKIACKSPQSDPADTPTSFQAQPKRSLRKADIEEEFLTLRKTSAGKAMHLPKPAADAEKDIKALMGTPVQKVDLPGNLPGSKRRPQTPKEKAQALEDLAGFKELFQTPGMDKPTTDEKTTKIGCKSPQPDPVDTPRSTIQRPKRSLRKAEVEEEFLALRKLTPSAGKAMHTPKPAVSDEKNRNTFVETPVQKLDLPGNLPGSKRRPQTPKEKAEALEDLAGFKELFQTPDHTEESTTDDKITGVSCKSPQPEPFKTSRSSRQRLKVSLVKAGMKEELLTAGKLTRTSGKTVQTHTEPTGGGKSIKAFKESPEQIVDPAASVTGSKRQLRTRKEKAHVLEDPGVFKELIPAPGHTEESMTTDKNTKIPCKSPPSELADTAKNTKRCPRTRLKKEVKEELSAVQKLTKTSGQSAHTHTEPASDGEGIKVVKQRAKKTPSPGVEEPSKRRPRAPKAKAQPLEDLAGFRELSETPGHTQESLTTGKAAKIPCKSPLLELADTRTSTKRHLRTHAQKVEVKEEPSAVGKFTQTSGEMADADKESVGKVKGIKTSKESAKQTLAPAACVTGSRRRPRAPRENAHALEDLAGFQDPAPGHPKESMTDDKTTKIPCKSLPEPVDTAISSKRRPRARAQKVEVKEEPLAAGQLTPASGETTHSDKEPAGEGNGVKAFKQPAKRKLDPENVIGSRRRPRAPKEKAQPPEDLASFQELSQTPGHTEELANGADSFTGTPKQTPDSGKPLKISRRVLRAPKVEPVRDQVGTRDLVKSQSKSNSSLPPPPHKRGCGKDGTVTGTKRLRFVPVPEEIVEELPASKKQRVPPKVRAKSPEPLVVMKRSLRISAKRSEPAEELNSDSMNANKEEHKFQDTVPENKGMSLRTRRQNKTDAEQPKTEVLILAGRMKINRNARKPMKTSQEIDIQSPGDGAQKAVPRGKASENKRCLRSVRQNKSSQPKVAEESEGQKSTGILVQNQEGKGEAGNSDSVHLRSRKTKSQSAASTLESESVQRVTRSVKRCAENPKKAEDIICIKKIRTRSHQDSEDI
ncbi:proliferation marker protein Ki-67 isoform X3 [Sapajus apella]|uniref:Proliferation marker protein Ki-67 isoform X3 n=1 Tax=Sapajus apella TaxID=9515 RepID=A0A6J3I7H3_SAPAP|nr:proliferation marker protein Ki-67 isoform X3 [Sapajus apella]